MLPSSKLYLAPRSSTEIPSQTIHPDVWIRTPGQPTYAVLLEETPRCFQHQVPKNQPPPPPGLASDL